jgi:hypothetical protein
VTVAEATAANEVAEQVILMAALGVTISPEIEHAVGILLINASKALMAGYDSRSFIAGLAAARSNFERKKKR